MVPVSVKPWSKPVKLHVAPPGWVPVLLLQLPSLPGKVPEEDLSAVSLNTLSLWVVDSGPLGEGGGAGADPEARESPDQPD